MPRASRRWNRPGTPSQIANAQGDDRLAERLGRPEAAHKPRPPETPGGEAPDQPLASLQQVGAQASNGLSGVAPTSQSASVKQTGAFAKLFKAKEKGKPVTGYEATSFDAVMLSFLK